jgi:hypothetical protein
MKHGKGERGRPPAGKHRQKNPGKQTPAGGPATNLRPKLPGGSNPGRRAGRQINDIV